MGFFDFLFGSKKDDYQENKNEHVQSLQFKRITKEEYEQNKKEIADNAIDDSIFFNKLDIDLFKKNIEYLKNWTCPYCGATIPEKKGSTFKCPSCKEKVYQKREIVSENKGLFTQEEKENIDLIWHEYNYRQSFFKLYKEAKELIEFNNITDDKKQNRKNLIETLHNAKNEYFSDKDLKKLRNCRFCEARLCNLEGINALEQDCYMQILYIDCILDYLMEFNSIYMELDWDNFVDSIEYKNDKLIEKEKKELSENELKEVEKEALKNWKDKCFLASGIFMGAFPNDENIKDYKDLFYKNASLIINSLKFTTPVTVDLAWEMIIEYNKKNSI